MKPIYYPTDEDRVLKHPRLWTIGAVFILLSWVMIGLVMLRWSAG